MSTAGNSSDALGGQAARAPASVLRRRLAGRQPAAPVVPPPVVAAPRSPERAASAAVARAADRCMGLQLSFESVAMRDVTLAELTETLPERSLLSLIEGPEDLLGVVSISSGLLGGLIEMQATGRVTARAEDTRMPTRADGAFCADFVNMALAELAADLTPLPGQPALLGYRYASYLPDTRPLGLLLDERVFRLIEMRLRAGPMAQRQGSLLIALPLIVPVVGAAVAALPDPPDLAEPASSDTGPPPLSRQSPMAEAVRAATLPLFAVLCRRPVTLGELRRLQPGDKLPLTHGAGSAVTLETASGQVLARGRMGQSEGHYALRLTCTPAKGAAPEPTTAAAFDHRAPDPAMAATALSGADMSPPPFDMAPDLDGAEIAGTEPLMMPFGDALDLSEPDPFRADDSQHPAESVGFEMAPMAMVID